MTFSKERLEKIYQLKDVIRYNCRNKIKDESVAEHSFFVSLIALELCNEYHLSDEITNKVLIKSLLHDMPETELNDITHDVKEKLNLREMLKKYEDEYFETNYPSYSKITNNYIPVVDEIVVLADTLSVYQYTNNEIMLGNKDKDINFIYEDCLQRIQKCLDKLDKALKL